MIQNAPPYATIYAWYDKTSTTPIRASNSVRTRLLLVRNDHSSLRCNCKTTPRGSGPQARQNETADAMTCVPCRGRVRNAQLSHQRSRHAQKHARYARAPKSTLLQHEPDLPAKMYGGPVGGCKSPPVPPGHANAQRATTADSLQNGQLNHPDKAQERER